MTGAATGTRAIGVMLTLWAAACTAAPRDLATHRPATLPAPVLALPDPNDDLSGLIDLPCAEGTACAETGPYLGDTCCTYGDNLVETGFLAWPGATEVYADGHDLIACGEHGVVAAHVDTLDAPTPTPFPEGTRCQQVALGPSSADGRMVWLAHPGDNTAPTTPRLSSFLLSADHGITPVEVLEGSEVLDLAWTGDRLAVVTGETGVQIYTVDPDGHLLLENTIGVGELSERVTYVDDHLYIATRDATLLSVDFSAPETPLLTSTVDLAGRPRRLHASATHIGIALGTGGLQVLDRTHPEAPEALGTLALAGSVQDLSMDGTTIAVATWHEAVLVDANTLRLIGSQRHTQPHARTLGVHFSEQRLYLADRSGVAAASFRPGYVAADLHPTPGSFDFGQHADSGQLALHNRGPMNLVLYGFDFPDPAFSTAASPLIIPPGDIYAVGIRHTGTGASGSMRVQSNDPDPIATPLYVAPAPTEGRLEGFEGEVQVLYAMDLSTPLAARVILDLEDLPVSASALHDGAATAETFELRLDATVPILQIRDLQDLILFPSDPDGPHLAVLDADTTVRGVRSHYDPEDLAHLVTQLLDE